MNDLDLEKALYASKRFGIATSKAVPDWREVHTELKGKDMTLALLWSEYKALHGEQAYEYSRFCQSYREWKERLNLSMRQVHRFGEKCFVDFAGRTIAITDARTGKVRQAQVFVGVLGASNYTYAEAVESQNIACWIGAHVRMMEFFGGVPQVIVPDNLKSGVTKADFYDPELNPTYQEWASHYGVAVLPARVRRPKDKAKVEVAVQIVQRWILAAIRNRTFYHLSDVNEAIHELLERLNRKPFRKFRGHREQLFLEREVPTLAPLPLQAYKLAIWKTEVGVGPDYHISLEGRSYSVPYTLYGKRVSPRLTQGCVEVYYAHVRIASHPRRYDLGPPITIPDHMPSSHRAVAEWTPERISTWAAEIGPSVQQFCSEVMSRRFHPEQGFRSCLGVIKLADKHGKEKLEMACSMAVRIRSFNGASVKNILVHQLFNRKDSPPEPPVDSDHENIRGAGYYNSQGELSHDLHQTIERLFDLNLKVMATALEEISQPPSQLSFEERIGLVVDREWSHRQDKRCSLRLKKAKLRQSACVEDINYKAERGLDAQVMRDLVTCRWVKAAGNVIITGPAGIGKSWLACALGNKACRDGYTCINHRVPRLAEGTVDRASGWHLPETAGAHCQGRPPHPG